MNSRDIIETSNIIDNLPVEILMMIFLLLGKSERLKTRLVCKRFDEIVRMKGSWEKENLMSIPKEVKIDADILPYLIDTGLISQLKKGVLKREKYNKIISSIREAAKLEKINKDKIDEIIKFINIVRDAIIKRKSIKDIDINRTFAVINCILGGVGGLISFVYGGVYFSANPFITKKPYCSSWYRDDKTCQLEINTYLSSSLGIWLILGATAGFIVRSIYELKSPFLKRLKLSQEFIPLDVEKQKKAYFKDASKSQKLKLLTCKVFENHTYITASAGILLTMLIYYLDPLNYNPEKCAMVAEPLNYQYNYLCLQKDLENVNRQVIGLAIPDAFFFAYSLLKILQLLFSAPCKLGLSAKKAFRRNHLFSQKESLFSLDEEIPLILKK